MIRNKYGNIPTTYGGMCFASKKEASHAKLLDALKKAAKPSERVERVDYQVPMLLIVNGVKICTYVADFLVRFSDGREEIHETKGFKTRDYKLKKKLVWAVYKKEIKEF